MSGNDISVQQALLREQKLTAELREQLERSRAELSEFAVLASHDLRAPLRALGNLASWIEEDLEAGEHEEVKKHLAAVRKRALRMDLLLRGLLEFSRVGRKDGTPEDFDVIELLGKVVTELKIKPEFTVNQPSGSFQITSPPLALTRVLQHLIQNAVVHHDRPDGQVDIRISDDGDQLAFEVSDDGPGIVAKQHDKAFRPLTTLKRRDEMEAGGMGLAVVKRATEFYGSGITLHSEGRGCTLRFAWPKQWPPPAVDG